VELAEKSICCSLLAVKLSSDSFNEKRRSKTTGTGHRYQQRHFSDSRETISHHSLNNDDHRLIFDCRLSQSQKKIFNNYFRSKTSNKNRNLSKTAKIFSRHQEQQQQTKQEKCSTSKKEKQASTIPDQHSDKSLARVYNELAKNIETNVSNKKIQPIGSLLRIS